MCGHDRPGPGPRLRDALVSRQACGCSGRLARLCLTEGRRRQQAAGVARPRPFQGKYDTRVLVPAGSAMQSASDNVTPSDIASRVRQNAWSAGIAAILLIVFGFYYLGRPTGTGLFERSALIFFFTLRVGGIALAAIAVGSVLAYRPVLVIDAVVSVAIGVAFALTGVGMLVGGGGTLQTVLQVVFGGMFISSGVRNWREYFWLAVNADRATAPTSGGSIDTPTWVGDETPSAPPGVSLASQLRERRSVTADDAPAAQLQQSPKSTVSEPPSVLVNPSNGHSDSATSPAAGEAQALDEKASSGEKALQDEGAAPDGFLASFADDGPPPKT